MKMTEKWIICLLIMVVIIFGGIMNSTVFAEDAAAKGDCGWDMGWVLDSDGVLRISGEGEMWDFSDATPWKFHNREIYEVLIEDGVESIGKNAFFGCTRLTKITIPDSVKTIRTNAFLDCTALESVNIPAGVEKIEPLAFENCLNLSEINVIHQNPNYKSSDGILFSKDGKTLIYCPSAKPDIQEFSVPEGVTTIDDYAFYQNTSLKTIIFPSTLTTISGNAFAWCTKLREVMIPSTVTAIGSHAFSYCNMLKTITIPGTVDYMGAYIFSSCGALETVRFLNGIKEIPDSVFYGCRKLKSVYIPTGVMSVNTSAFSDCMGLEDIYFGGSEYEWNNISFGSFNLPFLQEADIHYNYVE